MHSIHAMPSHSEHQHEHAMQIQPQQQEHQQPQLRHQTVSQQPADQQVVQNLQNSMATKLEAIGEQSADDHQQQQRQILSGVEPVVVQQQQQQHVVQNHLVQAPTPQPHLHQLQPSHSTRSLSELTAVGPQQQQHPEQPDDQQAPATERQQQQQHSSGGATTRLSSGTSHPLRPKAQIEGIVADGGGPIVQWLLDNYEIADGESLPRSTVYNHYLAHCRQLQMASVNAASFGKLIRSVFVGLKTRRLGTRGHSKYHYFGVRAKQHIQQELLQHQEAPASCSRDHNENTSSQNTENGSDTDSTNNGTIAECQGGSRGSISSTSGKRSKRGAEHNNIKRAHLYNHQPQQEGYPPQHQHLQMDATHTSQHQQHHLLHQHQLHRPNEPFNGVYYHLNDGTNGYNISGNENTNSNSSGDKLTGHHCTTTANSHHHLYQQHHSNQPQQQQQQHQFQADQHNNGQWLHCDLLDFRNHLGANWSTLVDEHWPQCDFNDLIEHLQAKNVTTLDNVTLINGFELFERKYKCHYKRMVELLGELKFGEVEQSWLGFWHPDSANQGVVDSTSTMDADPYKSRWPALEMVSGTAVDASNETHPTTTLITTTSATASTTTSAMTGVTTEETSIHNTDDAGKSHQNPQEQQQRQQQPPQTQPAICQLTFHLMYQLTSHPLVIERINQIDYNLYAALESFLMPDMLSPIPRPLAQYIRSFAKNIGSWIEFSVRDYSPQFVAEKSKSARAFGYALRRYTSLNHLSTASRAIWEKRSSLAQMSMDLSRVDLRDIEHQVSLVSNGDGDGDTATGTHPGARNSTGNVDTNAYVSSNASANQTGNQQVVTELHNENINTNNLVDSQTGHNHSGHHQQHHPQHLCTMQPAQLIQNFLHLLEDPYPANSWPDWCRNLVESRVCGLSLEEARNFVFKWNFYISLIMKDLTLRSASSLGSFQLIRLLFDEYMYYLVVSRLAHAQHKTPGQMLKHNSNSASGFEDL